VRFCEKSGAAKHRSFLTVRNIPSLFLENKSDKLSPRPRRSDTKIVRVADTFQKDFGAGSKGFKVCYITSSVITVLVLN